MSATILIKQHDTVTILTDAARYIGPKVTEFRAKTYIVPNVRAAYSVLGSTAVADVMAGMLEKFPPSSVDEFLRNLPTLVQTVAEALASANPAHASTYEFTGVVVGAVSESVGWPAAYHYVHATDREIARREAAGERFDGAEPNKLHVLPAGVLPMPSPCPEYLARVGWMQPSSLDDFDPIRDGIVIMEAQRRTTFLEGGVGAEFHAIGGFITATTITTSGVEQRTVHHWPEDRIGERIRPDVIRMPNRAARRAAKARRSA